MGFRLTCLLLCHQTGLYALPQLRDEAQTVRVERHLARCAACREEVAGLARTARLLERVARRHGLTPEQWERIRRQVIKRLGARAGQGDARRRPWPAAPFPPAPAAAAGK